jgi:LmbE family N-acetylglucosaminyl deacetylase
MTTVLVVVAHPDDAELAMAMRIRWYSDHGAHVLVHCLTPGSSPERADECRAAGDILGVKRYTFSEIADTRFADHRGAINAELFRVFGIVRPDIVYTHHPSDQHLDHATTATELTAVALREAANLTYFRSPYSVDFEPTMIFMGTDKLLDAKSAALKCFTSQRQLDMDVFHTLTKVSYRQFVHHRVSERFPSTSSCAELFRIARRVELAEPL